MTFVDKIKFPNFLMYIYKLKLIYFEFKYCLIFLNKLNA